MDLGVVGFDGLVGSNTTSTPTSDGFVSLALDPETKYKVYGSGGFLKQERSSTITDEDEWRSSKLAKTHGDLFASSSSKAMLLQERDSLLRSNNSATLFCDGQQMLSFSSPKSETSSTLHFSYHPYSRDTGYSSGSMHGAITGTRGLFTPSQWMELEHQALIYKYITANVPVPSHLLFPIRKALDSAGFCNFSNGVFRPNALGWGAFHLGFSNSTDPEPGRCRRTDGKKWRCSRDAAVDQKYCERHMNRGRHRSRKPVEQGHLGHAGIATATTTITTTTPNATTNNNNGCSSSLSSLMPGNCASDNLSIVPQQEHKNMQHPLASDTSPASSINRIFMNNNKEINASERMQDNPSLPMLPSTLELKPKENIPFMIHKHQIRSYEESTRNDNEFGLVTSDSLLNPSQKNSTFSPSLQNQDTEPQHSLRHFIDDCPNDDMQSDQTQLSISIPMAASSEFMSFSSSTTNEKLTLSPLRLSRELDPIQMCLGVGSGINESNTRQANWVPITWESCSMGGPLGEVLNLSNNNNNVSEHCSRNSSALNLMTEGWDNSPPIGSSSPTGILQKTAFGSLSNSSAGSSPRAYNNKTQEGANFCNDLLGSTMKPIL
ncbi:hypothetical protein Lal_00045822 [Lupinus albus]|uniref:Growth-regulating factor n=1 Tax=Lupinus albus TaxID=3870 RepID=A0A6A4P5B2_LUPAL|nr:putative transcription factor interactor and regulator C3H-WRC/GRF family [Lupinus albus]KAF1886589.1 hypothetical protein Lal_00045822 [Lupinus albus]